ncbi:hypothetical protein SLA2020_317210 [Shorea laevis]
MGSSFDRWEKDPFFYAAEEVQESADRMESTYRTWIHAKKDTSGTWKCEELCRDLHTALGTTKWQLEEFGKAVQSSYNKGSGEDAKDRHLQFIAAIEDQISKIEKSLQESALSEGKTMLPWVQLDEGERDELAWFLSGPSQSEENKDPNRNGNDNETPQEPVSDCLKNSSHSVDWGSLEAQGEKSHGHRRIASASADIGEWKIVIADAGFQQNPAPAKGQPPLPPRKIPSLSGFLNSMESASKLKWSTNSVRKWKAVAVDCQQETDLELLRSPQMTRGLNACYERSKSCLGCDDCCDKHLNSWYGAIQRQLQRSQYQVQYSQPFKVAFSIILFICLIGEFS